MPFLRAALLRKQKEQEKILPPVVIVEEEPEIEEAEPEEFTDFEALHKIIDARAEEFEADDENISEPEEISEFVESVDAPEIISGGDDVSEVPAEGPEPEPEIAEPVEEVFTEVQEGQPEQEPEPEELIIAPEPETEPEPEIITEDFSEEPAPEIESVAEEFSEEPEPEELPEIISEEAEEIAEPEEVSEEPAPEPEEEIISEETAQEETPPELPEIISEAIAEEPEQEPEISPEPEQELELEPEPHPDDEPAPEEFKLKYDFTSGERYVDSVSTKTEFDKMLDELANISKELLSWQTEKFARDYTSKFQGDFDKAESDAKKYEAFLGGYITNASMTLYDNGYKDIAIKQLEQAKSILEARKKLEDETEAIKNRVEEQDDAVDLSDILGLFGDG